MPTTTPLKDDIDALTAYANETTGGSDTDLSSAVATLVAGYGGGGGSMTLDDYALAQFSPTAQVVTVNPVNDVKNTNLTSVIFTYAPANQTASTNYGKNFSYNSSLKYFVVTNFIGNWRSDSCLRNCALEAVDMAVNKIDFTSVFLNNPNFTTLILRKSGVCALNNVGSFSNTPFANGGSGGHIYIPKTLYDALGTGTNDYKAASNWSTLEGYGTITWHAIEGSYYETHYADGTPISS